MNKTIIEPTIRLIKPRNGLVAICSINLKFDLGEIFFGSIGLHTKLNKPGEYRLTYPTKKINNSEVEIFFPLTPELSNKIEKIIVEEYENIISE